MFIPRYFIIFDMMLNGIISLISLSGFSLLVFKNITEFYVLVLYPDSTEFHWWAQVAFW